MEALEQKRRRNYVAWYDMRLEAMMDLIISTDLDAHISELMRKYLTCSKSSEPNNAELYHIMNKIKANHLIFTRLQRNSFKHLFDKGLVFTVQAGNYVYQKKRIAKKNIYFVLYGELEYRMENAERFGERVTMGLTVGEEILFEQPPLKNRIESVVATV